MILNSRMIVIENNNQLKATLIQETTNSIIHFDLRVCGNNTGKPGKRESLLKNKWG